MLRLRSSGLPQAACSIPYTSPSGPKGGFGRLDPLGLSRKARKREKVVPDGMCIAGGFLSWWGWGKGYSRQTSTGVPGTFLERDLKVISPQSLINNWKERQ